jgi:hypothetical protein
MYERTTHRGETYQDNDSTIKAFIVTDDQPINNKQTEETSREQTKHERFAKAWRLASSVIMEKDKMEERNELEWQSNESTCMHQRQ